MGTGTSATVPSPVLKFCKSCFIGPSTNSMTAVIYPQITQIHIKTSGGSENKSDIYFVLNLCNLRNLRMSR